MKLTPYPHLFLALLLLLVGCSRDAAQTPQASKLGAGWRVGEPASDTGELAKKITNSLGMRLVLIPKGTFMMKASPGVEGSDDDAKQHEVTISRNYYLGEYEVTQGQYQKLMGQNPSCFQGAQVSGDSSHHPVESLTWDDAVEFCERLSALPEEQAAGRVYRLPTEAEWEYACRAGTKTAYIVGNDIKRLRDYAWYGANSELPVSFWRRWLASYFDRFEPSSICTSHAVG